jgi:hypothetical protein
VCLIEVAEANAAGRHGDVVGGELQQARRVADVDGSAQLLGTRTLLRDAAHLIAILVVPGKSVATR